MSNDFPVNAGFEVHEDEDDYDACEDFPVQGGMDEYPAYEEYSSEGAISGSQATSGSQSDEEEPSEIDNVDWNSEHGDFLMRVYSAWANMHLPPGNQIRHIDDGFRSGVNLYHLLDQLDHDQPELEYPEPRNNSEKRRNIWLMVAHLLPVDDPENNEDLQEVVTGVANGDRLTTMSILINVSRDSIVEKVYYAATDMEGSDALKNWLGTASIRVDSSRSEMNIDDHDKLRTFIQFIGPQFTKGIDKLVRDKDEEERKEYYLKFIHIHFGVPPMLYPSNSPSIASYYWYTDVKFLWLAEVFNSVMLTRGNNNSEKKVIHEAISAARAKDIKIADLDTNLYALYSWLQDKISFFKIELKKFDSEADRRHLDVLTDLYDIINNEQQTFSKLRLKCIDDHTSLQQKIRLSGYDQVFERKDYNIQVIDRMWKCLLELETKLELKLENEGKKHSNKHVLYLEWNRELNLLEHWMNRWKNFLTDQVNLTYNSPNIASRLDVVIGMHKELEEKSEYIDKLNATTKLIVEEHHLDEFDRNNVLSRTESIVTEWKKFVKEIKMYKRELNAMKIQARDLDIIYHELKDLMTKLDVELHEFYEFFSHRPHCFTVKKCNLLKTYTKEAWAAMFPVSLEVDAVLSLAEELEVLRKKNHIPVNHLTSLTPRYIKQRWENLLVEANKMEIWLEKETEIVGHTEKYLMILNGQCEWCVTELNHKLKKLQQQLKNTDLSDTLTDNVHNTVLTITKFRDGSQEKLVELAEPLLTMSIATPNLHILYNLFDDVESTLHLLNDDIPSQIQLIESRDINPAIIEALRDQYWYGHQQIILTEQQFLTIMYENNDDYFNLEECMKFVKSLDPDCRVSLSTFIDMNTSNDRAIGKSNKQLCQALSVLADDKPFILESEIRRWLEPDYAAWCIGKMTDYLGSDIHEYTIVGDKAYDYERFSLNITGRHKKLEVETNTH